MWTYTQELTLIGQELPNRNSRTHAHSLAAFARVREGGVVWLSTPTGLDMQGTHRETK